MTTTANPPSPYQILHAVEMATGVPTFAILADNRLQATSYARFLAMLMVKELRPWSTNLDAAVAVGKKDAGTGRHGLMRAAYLLANDEQFKAAYAKVKAMIAAPEPLPL